MQTKDKSINSFGTFLDTIKSVPSQSFTRQAPTRLLDHLSEGRPKPVVTLMKELDMNVFEFGQTLKAAEDAGLVEISGSQTDQEVCLTNVGQQVLGISRSR